MSYWVINKVGINAPLIQQTRTYYCGYATLLQAIYGAGTEQALINSIVSGGNSLHKQQDKLKTCLCFNPDNEAMDQDNICTYLNSGNCLPPGVFVNTNYHYNKTDSDGNSYFKNDPATNTVAQFINTLNASFSTGWTPFFLTRTGGQPYNYGATAHYISIVGYDPISDTILLHNCHFGNNTGGIYTVGSSLIYDNIEILYYCTAQ